MHTGKLPAEIMLDRLQYAYLVHAGNCLAGVYAHNVTTDSGKPQGRVSVVLTMQAANISRPVVISKWRPKPASKALCLTM